MAEKNMNAKISVEFEETANRQQLSSGDNLPTLFGKIKKIISDLSTSAFSGSYNDLSDRPTTATTETDGLMSAEDKTKLDDADKTYALKSKYGDTTINVGRKEGTYAGICSTAEGQNTTASDACSHAEGSITVASGVCSHAEGVDTVASDAYSHAEGDGTTASGVRSHAGGGDSVASGDSSFAHGKNVQALHDHEVAFGKYNKSSSDTLFSVGDGTSESARHNAFEITKTGGYLHNKNIATTDLIPTELPANGGNADTVDGMHASDFMPINGDVKKYGTIRMNGSDGIRAKHIDGNDTEADGALYLNYHSPNATIYMNGGYTAIHSGNIGSQSVNYANSAGYVNPNVVVKSLTFPNVPLNESGWGSLGITTSDYNIIGCTCTSNDRHARVYRGNNATGWFVYVTQQYPTPGVAAANEVVNVVVFYI